MGACASKPTGDPAAEARSREIDKALKEDEKQQAKTVKLLLLGAGASGKSTVLKQMRLIHNRPFSPDEIEDYRKISFSNLITGLRAIIDQLDELGVAILPQNRPFIALIDNEVPINTGEPFPQRYHQAVKALWADPAVVEVYKRAHEYALQENLPYFFEKIDDMFRPGWKPSNEDVLRVRAKTTGISETRFELKGDITIRLFDVGGQRSERRKWISAFEAVTSVLFLASLADYNASLIEDADSNGMMESLILFESIVNSQWFTNSSIILFLNKADVLAQKIQDPTQQIRDYFPDFSGKPGSFTDAVQYFQGRFQSLNRNAGKEVYIHVTTATSTENIKVVMTAVLDTIIRGQLRDMAII